MMANKYSNLAKNTVIFTISSFGSKLLAFLLVPFYTSVLSRAEYGTSDLITTTSNLLIFVVTISIADAVMRFAIDGGDSKYGVLRYGLKVVMTGCFVLGLMLSALYIWNPVHWEASLFILLFLTVLTNALNQLLSNYLRAINNVTSVAVMGVLVTAVSIGCNLVLLLVFKLGVIGYLISFVAGYFLSTVYGFAVVNKNDREWISQICDADTRKMMVSYSFPLIFNGLAWWVNSSLDRYFIVLFYGAALNGLYAAASKIPTIISVVNQIFSQAWNLSAIKEFDEDDKEGFFREIYSAYNFWMVFSCNLLILLDIPLAKVLFSKEYFEAWKYSPMLIISALFSAMSGFLGSIFVAVKNSKIFAASTVSAAIINTTINLLLIPKYGGLGAAMATALSFFVIWAVRYVCVIKYIHLKINLLRDLVAYGLLAVQAFVEQFKNHGYYIQLCIVFLVLILYINEMKRIVLIIKKTVSRT